MCMLDDRVKRFLMYIMYSQPKCVVQTEKIKFGWSYLSPLYSINGLVISSKYMGFSIKKHIIIHRIKNLILMFILTPYAFLSKNINKNIRRRDKVKICYKKHYTISLKLCCSLFSVLLLLPWCHCSLLPFWLSPFYHLWMLQKKKYHI